MTPELISYLESLSIQNFNSATSRVSLIGGKKAAMRTILKEAPVKSWLLNPDNIKYLDNVNAMALDAYPYLKDRYEKKSTPSASSDGFREHIRSLLPVINSEDIKDCFLYDKETREVVRNIDFNIYTTLMGVTPAEILSNGEVATVQFNPFRTESIYTDGAYRYYNLYNPPKWRYIEVTPAMPEIFKLFFEHLFKTEEARLFVYHWLYHLITKRNQTYLCLIGARGIGKGILTEIAKALVGFKYFETVGDSILTDKFNAPLKNKRLIHLDEITLDDAEKFATLKRFANDLIPFETKGKDSVTGVNYTSMILSTNHITGVDIQPQERRFSLPELTDVNLQDSKVFPVERIDELIAILRDEDSQEIAELGQWILLNGKSEKYATEFYPYKGEYFYELCYLSLKEWQKFIVDKIVSKEKSTYLLKDLQSDFRAEHGERSGKYFPQTGSKTLIEFISDYAHMGRFKLGKLGVVRADYRDYKALIVSEHFAPEGGVNFTEVTGQESNDTDFLN